ncbi:MAG: tyrosine-type recombinase/integrase [Bacillota bacterium]|nr:tyrosine-type recombinase/integrase [Bacillota bacterium]
MPKNSNKTFGQALASYYHEKRSQGIAESTIATYQMHLEYFSNAFNNIKDVPCYEFDKMDYTYFLDCINADPQKNKTTVATYCRSVKAFLYWLMDNDYIEKPFKVQIPKAPKTIKVTYTDEELKQLLQDPRPCSYSQYQTWVYINFVIATGLRESSILSIQLKEYSPTEGTVLVKETKSGNPLYVHLNVDMCNILNEYINNFELNPTDYIFCAQGGKRMARSTIIDNVAKYNRGRGVDKTSIHLFRHTFAKRYLESGGSIVDLQKLLDHANIETTMQYVKDYSLDVKKSVEVFNPQKQFTDVRKKNAINRKRKMQ